MMARQLRRAPSSHRAGPPATHADARGPDQGRKPSDSTLRRAVRPARRVPPAERPATTRYRRAYGTAPELGPAWRPPPGPQVGLISPSSDQTTPGEGRSPAAARGGAVGSYLLFQSPACAAVGRALATPAGRFRLDVGEDPADEVTALGLFHDDVVVDLAAAQQDAVVPADNDHEPRCAPPDDRPVRVRGLLQHAPATPHPEPSRAAPPAARWRHRPGPLPRPAARPRRRRDS